MNTPTKLERDTVRELARELMGERAENLDIYRAAVGWGHSRDLAEVRVSIPAVRCANITVDNEDVYARELIVPRGELESVIVAVDELLNRLDPIGRIAPDTKGPADAIDPVGTEHGTSEAEAETRRA